MASKTCQICGAPSGMYPLCKECLKLKEEGIVVKDEESKKWIKIEEEEETELYDVPFDLSEQTCALCDKKGSGPLCKKHYEEMIALTKDYMTLDHNDLKQTSYKFNNELYYQRESEAFETNALTYIAMTYMLMAKFNENVLEYTFKRINALINDYNAYLPNKTSSKNEENPTKTSIQESEKTTDIKNTCLFCDKETKGHLCKEHYSEMIAIKEDLVEMDYDDLDLYFYNMNAYIYRNRKSKKFTYNALRFIAIAYTLKTKYNDNRIEQAYNRVEAIITKHDANISKEETTEQNDEPILDQEEIIKTNVDRAIEKIICAEDNHKVRSMQEQIIDNMLYQMRLVHCYEAELIINDSYGKKYCDWFIPVTTTMHGIYIEYWGMGNASYLKNKKLKEEIYDKENIPYIGIEKDETKNSRRLQKKLIDEMNRLALKHFDIKNFIK